MSASGESDGVCEGDVCRLVWGFLCGVSRSRFVTSFVFAHRCLRDLELDL